MSAWQPPGLDVTGMDLAGMEEVRPCLEGLVPSIMATVAPDGTPNVAYLSQVYPVDDDHVALSFQFFNKTRQNLQANPRSTVLVLHPFTARYYRFHLRFERTEAQGPVFERMKAQLAGIASHEGMAEVFRLRGADIHRVLAIERLPPSPPPESAVSLPPPPVRPDALALLRRSSRRLGEACSLDALLRAALDTLADEWGIRHAMVLIHDAASARLYTLASHGYARSGVGSEIAVGDGVVGVAARERVPIRINHMTTAQRYNHAMRQGAGEPLGDHIPYPGLPQPRSQLAVPLLSVNRLVGVLFVESDEDMRFSGEDEDLLVALGGHLAAGIDLMREADAPCADTLPPAPVPRPPALEPLRVRRFRRDDSVFVNNAYLIKGVAGAILWRLLNDHEAGRRDFTNRELRLDSSLGLPDVSDNLEARLLLLQRRLAEQCPLLVLRKTGRGCLRFEAGAPLVLEDVA